MCIALEHNEMLISIGDLDLIFKATIAFQVQKVFQREVGCTIPQKQVMANFKQICIDISL